jgi:16S rRNA G966 N2-methylase RsmD
VIIWAKDRTVPWAHQGQMRNLFEYILLFSKEEKYNFFIDEVRDFETLKKWWVKYPERYNPKGKTPDGLWHFDIPTQGSWGNGYLKHFCPLPEELIEQILKISSREGDLVLDPFAGSGAVLAKADSMKRRYVGFELNKSYIKMFENYLKKTGKEKKEQYLSQVSRQLPQQKFTSLITDLRALKFARVILSKLPFASSSSVHKIYVVKTKDKPTKKNAISSVDYIFFVNHQADEKQLLLAFDDLASKAPLSKYGIQPRFVIEKNIDNFLKYLGDRTTLFSYTVKATHKFKKQLPSHKFIETSKDEKILSKIKVELDEKDYE